MYIYSILDAFFKSIENQKQKLNIESATKFIGGILKRHGVDDVSFQLEVENAVWVMDYSFDIRLYPDLAVELWPEVGVVQWLFYNIF